MIEDTQTSQEEEVEEDWENDSNRTWIVMLLLSFLLDKSLPGEEQDLDEMC